MVHIPEWLKPSRKELETNKDWDAFFYDEVMARMQQEGGKIKAADLKAMVDEFNRTHQGADVDSDSALGHAWRSQDVDAYLALVIPTNALMMEQIAAAPNAPESEVKRHLVSGNTKIAQSLLKTSRRNS